MVGLKIRGTKSGILDEMEEYVKMNQIDIAVLTLPGRCAPSLKL